MNPIENIPSHIYKNGKVAAYSPAGKYVARKVTGVPSGKPLRRIIKSLGLQDKVRRIASGTLPEGAYYAKLTIARWEPYEGRSFRLFEGSTVVYGNEVEPPERGFPLEYRNIIVSSRDVSRFSLDIDVPFKLAISRGSFSTPQQDEYDVKYNVTQHGDIYYSLRGNRIDPKHLIITFPGFAHSTSRISYPISYMKDITDADLNDTLMVCFQDRNLVAGSYMMVDNAGCPLYDRVFRCIEELRAKYGIDQSHILLFGASKGGSIALDYANGFPEAHLLIVAPQVDLLYYLNRPVFRNNLLLNRVLRGMRQPTVLLRKYFSEGRNIDYFYTNNDESSNQSIIEFANDIENLTKYRIEGSNSSVARMALPAILGIIRRFIGEPKEEVFSYEELRTFCHGNEIQVQVRLDAVAAKVKHASWFLEGFLGQTRFLQKVSDHQYDFVKFTSADQQLFADYDLTEKISSIKAIEANGTQWSSELTSPLNRSGSAAGRGCIASLPLSLDNVGVQNHAVLDGKAFGRFRYCSRRTGRASGLVEIHFVPELSTIASDFPEPLKASEASHILVVQSLDSGSLAQLMALRIVIAAGAERMLVVVHGQSMPAEALAQLAGVDWKDTYIVVTGTDPELNADAHLLRAGYRSGRISVASVSELSSTGHKSRGGR